MAVIVPPRSRSSSAYPGIGRATRAASRSLPAHRARPRTVEGYILRELH